MYLFFIKNHSGQNAATAEIKKDAISEESDARIGMIFLILYSGVLIQGKHIQGKFCHF